jgi:integrase
MSALAAALADYLALRHGLGHKLADAERLLPRFVAFMDEAGETTVTVKTAMAWACQPIVGPDSNVWSQRLTHVRGFARYLTAIDPATQIPPLGLLASKKRWKAPYIYTDDDIAALLTAAGSMRFAPDAATYQTLFGLLAVTGMRVGETIRLDVADVNLDDGILLVRESKFGKSRLIPVLPDTTAALSRYLARRTDYTPLPGTESFFVSRTGRRLIYESVFSVFDHLRARTALGMDRTAARTPRIHDLRHTFAVTTLLGWYREGKDVAGLLPRLSTYLGHREPRNTYWYLSAVPELLAEAAQRLDPVIGAVTPR